MRTPVSAALLVAMLFAAPSFAAGPDFAGMQIQPYEPTKAAPAFALPDLDGKTVRLEDLKGKVVMLVFWATWWPVCREELPSVNRAYGEFKDKGLEIRLVDFREDPETVKKAVRDRGYTAPVLLDQSGDVTGRAYGVWGPPTVFFVDRKGQLLGRAVGPRGWDSPAAKTFLRALLELPG